MQNRPFDFSCSDAVLTQEWEARVSTHDPERLSSLIVQHLDPASQQEASAFDIKPIISPLQTILGISAEEPGFTCVRIGPHPNELSKASGWVTIPEGLVSVSWTRAEGFFSLNVSIPIGVHLKAILPAHPGDGLLVDGERIDPDSQTIWTAHHIELAVLPGSNYRFEAISPPSV